ncbi:ankyrin repeat domain-containing protein 26-like [Pseudopipra pipra]|uniref:ankyrin repeat domain-containing protein 26-like n=1 Tax=Pseudopipra pipra TaxID=415032 RepID=UPI003138B685
MGMYKELYLEEVKTRRCLAKKLERLEKLLRTESRKLRVNEEKGSQSQLEEMKKRYSEKVKEVDRFQREVAELSQQLDREREQCTQLEAKNQALQEELSALRGECENLAMDKCQLQEELAKLHHHLETNVVDRSQLEQCKREVEEQADQEIRQKLQEVNEFLQVSEFLPSVHRSRVVAKAVEGNFAKAFLPEMTLCVLVNVSELLRDLQWPTPSSFWSATEADLQSQAALSAEFWLQVHFWIHLAWDILASVWD